MRYLKHFKLFESNNSEIELFEDLLQEYFDEFRIYPKDEVDAGGMYGSTEANGDSAAYAADATSSSTR
jgi:hypothetical protein